MTVQIRRKIICTVIAVAKEVETGAIYFRTIRKLSETKKRRRTGDADFRSGQGWIRTIVANATDLQSAPFSHSGTYPGFCGDLGGT